MKSPSKQNSENTCKVWLMYIIVICDVFVYEKLKVEFPFCRSLLRSAEGTDWNSSEHGGSVECLSGLHYSRCWPQTSSCALQHKRELIFLKELTQGWHSTRVFWMRSVPILMWRPRSLSHMPGLKHAETAFVGGSCFLRRAWPHWHVVRLAFLARAWALNALCAVELPADCGNPARRAVL